MCGGGTVEPSFGRVQEAVSANPLAMGRHASNGISRPSVLLGVSPRTT